MSRSPATGHRAPRGRDRAASEQRILAATWRLFEREGPLAGINLQEVADEAGVNRSLVYQYFGTREALVRSALALRLEQARPTFGAAIRRPFAQRRRRAFKIVLADPLVAQLMMQLVLAGDAEVKALPMFEDTRSILARDLTDGSLPPSADAEVMHAMTVVLTLGYTVFREHLADELEIDLPDLDRRAAAVYGRMVDALVTQ